MNKAPLPDWDPEFAFRSPMYEPLRPLAQKFSAFTDRWPELEDYQRVLNALPAPILTLNGAALKIVKQDDKPRCFEEHYAPRIYLTGEIQTRTANWHDFFQYLTWFIFPKTKAVINAIHIPAAKQRLAEGIDPGRRTPIENTLSLFDEGGAVILSSDESLLQLIRNFRWKTLFWERRDEVASKLQCVTFGHAMYEKGLAPYIGMTANCILLTVDESFFSKTGPERLNWLDDRLAAIFSAREYREPKDLSPFPILGLPGWDPHNACETYYDNTGYFRSGRAGKRTPPEIRA